MKKIDFKIFEAARGLAAKYQARAAAALALAVFALVYISLLSAPFSFREGTLVSVESGKSAGEIGALLAEKRIIRSGGLLATLLSFGGGDEMVKAGDYYFDSRDSLPTVLWRLTRGRFGFKPFSITLPEGSNIFEIAAILENKLKNFDSGRFINLAEEKEGYLFPDTYQFPPGADERDVVLVMERNFKEKVATLAKEIQAYGKPLSEVIIMASILEEEAHDFETRRMIAGILWRRLQIGMPLQVDAAFQYVNGKNTFQLTSKDLDIDSPYNTYKNKGLPKGPISNPGFDAIKAAVAPKKSNYLFYLSDLVGNTYYAADFDTHVANKFKYLK